MVGWSPDSWVGLRGTTAPPSWQCPLNKRTWFGLFVQNLSICFCAVSSTYLEHIWLTLTQKAAAQLMCLCVYFSSGNPKQKHDKQFLATSINLRTLWRNSQSNMLQNQWFKNMSSSSICYFKMWSGVIFVWFWNILVSHIVVDHWSVSTSSLQNFLEIPVGWATQLSSYKLVSCDSEQSVSVQTFCPNTPTSFQNLRLKSF